jgi:DNA modification methylase
MSARAAVDDPDFTLYVGDARDVLPRLPSGTVDCVVSSPPFYGLRDYGTGQWEGGDQDCDHDQRRRERDPDSKQATNSGSSRDGVAGNASCRKCGARRVDRQIGLEASPDEWVASLVGVFRECRRILKPAGVMWVECGDSYAGSGPNTNAGFNERYGHGAGDRKQELQSASKSAAMPNGSKPKDLLGQPWMLAFALRADGWYLRQCVIWHKSNAMPESVRDRCTTAHSYVFLLSKSPRYWFDADAISEPVSENAHQRYTVAQDTPKGRDGCKPNTWANGSVSEKNARSVWTIPTSGYPDAHFATFPEALVERMLKAGCPEGGTVLDPFMGSGTTALVARRLGRKAIGVELSPAYAAMAARRTDQLSLLA